jgi:putative nucleotidyltransferase with HDIG domain
MATDRKHIKELFPEIDEIANADLREKVVDTWLIAIEDSRWGGIDDFPWIPGRAEFITNVQHSRGVTQIGMAIAKTLLNGKDIAPGVTIDLDVVIAGCLLHDVGKLLEYALPPEPPGTKSPLGKYMLHHVLGAHLAIKAGLPAEVVHCIESHREPDSFERSYEAKILSWSDRLHADAMLMVHPEVRIV